MDESLREKTKQTARMLFHTLEGGTGFETPAKAFLRTSTSTHSELVSLL